MPEGADVADDVGEIVEEDVFVSEVCEDEVEEEVEEMRSVLSCTIRTPYALNPPGDVNVAAVVEVTPLLDAVTSIVVREGAIQVQNKVDQTFDSPGPAQERVISPCTGQHVTVVIEETPVVSWQALTYPAGHAIPGEKKAVDSKGAFDGRHDVAGSSIKTSFS